MKLIKARSGETTPLSKENFSDFKTVQGARMAQKDSAVYAESPRRYKLFCDTAHEIYIISGAGFIKWARGELPFTAGDCFCAEEIGEYELNGNCVFEVIKK